MQKNSSSPAKRQTLDVRRLVFTALIIALAYVSTLVFNIKVEFLTFDLKNSLLALCALIFGPVSGIVSSLIVSLLEMITISGTGFWGFLMNFISSAVFAFTAGIIYKYKKTMAGAVLSVTAASVAMVAVMIGMNLIITPIYTGMPVSAIVGMILPLLLPFNAIKAAVGSAVTLIIYKPVKKAFISAGVQFGDSANTTNAPKNRARTAAVWICSGLIIIAGIALFLLIFNGKIVLFR
ncbi:MAG: ECF transporter S component [Acutalibacteraceae bacterium]